MCAYDAQRKAEDGKLDDPYVRDRSSADSELSGNTDANGLQDPGQEFYI